MLERFLTRWRRKEDVPIINDGRGNLPSIRIIRGNYQVPGAGGGGGIQYTFDGGQAAYDWLATQGYILNSDAYSCISLVAQSAQQVKFWDGEGNTKAMLPAEHLLKAIDFKPTAPDDPLYNARVEAGRRRKALDPKESIALLVAAGGAQFIGWWVSYLLLSGNNYIEIEREGGGADGGIKRLHLLRPDRVRPEIDQSRSYYRDSLTGWKVRAFGNPPREVAKDNIVHSKLFNPMAQDDILGMPPLAAAMLRIDMQNEGARHAKRVLQRGYSPGWVELESESEWDENQIAALQDRIKSTSRNNEALIMQYGKWHEMGFRPAESGFVDSQLLTKRDICSVFHVDPALVGDTTGRTYATYRESRRSLYMEAVIPVLTQFRDDWNRTIGAELQSPLDFDRDSFDAITAAREEASDRVTKLWQAGLITRDEARSDLEYDEPAPDAVFYAPATFVPMDGEDGNAKPTNE